MSQMFQDFTKFDSAFVIGMLCLIVFLWVLGFWKLIEVIFQVRNITFKKIKGGNYRVGPFKMGTFLFYRFDLFSYDFFDTGDMETF